MVQYDPIIIETFAKNLYSKARTVVFTMVLVGGFVGGVAFALASRASRGSDPGLGLAVVVISASLGYMVGQSRAFSLRLQAQVALCQVQIERNTSGSVKVTRVG